MASPIPLLAPVITAQRDPARESEDGFSDAFNAGERNDRLRLRQSPDWARRQKVSYTGDRADRSRIFRARQMMADRASAALRLFVGKDVHKFSCAHMTVFPDGTKELLHGHNFQASIELDLVGTDPDLLDFALLKKALQEQCDAWTERLLLPGDSPQLGCQTTWQHALRLLPARIWRRLADLGRR